MNREQLLQRLRQLAELNGDVPVGERAFFADTRLTRRTLWRAGFANYGAAVEAAGYKRNELKQAYSDDTLFPPLAKLTRRLQHFPTEAERIVERHRDSTFPGPSAYRRRASGESLVQALLRWCRSNNQFQDVAELLRTSNVGKREQARARTGEKVVNGYVYLMRCRLATSESFTQSKLMIRPVLRGTGTLALPSGVSKQKRSLDLRVATSKRSRGDGISELNHLYRH